MYDIIIKITTTFFFLDSRKPHPPERALCGSRWGSKTPIVPDFYKRCTPWLELETCCADLKPFADQIIIFFLFFFQWLEILLFKNLLFMKIIFQKNLFFYQQTGPKIISSNIILQYQSGFNYIKRSCLFSIN
jgi:hypothetical protein